METKVCNNAFLFLRKLSIARCQLLPPLKRVNIPINKRQKNFSPMPCVEKTTFPKNEEIIKKYTILQLGSPSYNFLTDSTLLKKLLLDIFGIYL